MSNPFLGEIRIFGGNFAPAGWAFCNGQLLSIANDSALYTLIGTTYGGDGVNSFALPDLRSRVAVGEGTGGGFSPRVIGQNGGSEQVTLTPATVAAHTHSFSATSASATATVPTNNLLATPSSTTTAFLYLNGAATGTTDAAPANTSVQPSGGGLPHDNIMPSLALNYIIALQGVFPSRN
jgi:microcystin-dependent protein